MEYIISNYYFIRLTYILFIVLLGFLTINDLYKKDKIKIEKNLNYRTINIRLLLKYLFISFIVRITLEQLVICMNITTTDIQIPSNIFEIFAEFIATCIFAPIFEEIIFRFGLYKKLNKVLKTFISIIITSIIFSLIHIYDIDGFIILLGISLVWNHSFYKTKNLIYPILLHFFHNLYAVSDNLLNYSDYWYVILIINIIGYIIIKKKQKK